MSPKILHCPTLWNVVIPHTSVHLPTVKIKELSFTVFFVIFPLAFITILICCSVRNIQNLQIRDISYREFNIGLVGCGIRLKIKTGCGIMKIFEKGCGRKLQWQDSHKTATCRILSESQNLKIHEGTTLLSFP